MEIGEMLRNKRIALNLTQEDVANKFNVTRQTVSRWENELSYPNIDTLVALSIFFDFSLDEMLRGDSMMVKDFSRKVKLSERYKWWKGLAIGLIIVILILSLNYFSPTMSITNDNIDSVKVTKSNKSTDVEIQLKTSLIEKPEVWGYSPSLENGIGMIEVYKKNKLQAFFKSDKVVSLEIPDDFLTDINTIKIKGTDYTIDVKTGQVFN